MTTDIETLLFSTYGAQLGELAWHAIHVDDSIFQISDQHSKSIVEAVNKHSVRGKSGSIRILEIGAYAHYSAAKAAEHLGGEGTSHDISPASLLVAQKAAIQAGVKKPANLVAGDFHDLPFSDNHFDVVFCASCVHHTFKPWLVIGEMLRVLRPGGILILQNEPIGRSAGFYLFRSNRTDSFTPIEKLMDERGSILQFSSPFTGSRPEHLFGMIENDRMPFDMIQSALTVNADIVERLLNVRIAPLDEKLLAIPASNFMEAEIAKLFLEERDALSTLLNEDALRAGIRLPTTDEIWLKAYAIAPSLRKIANSTGQVLEEELARTFGAAINVTVKKRGNASQVGNTMFKRSVKKHGEIFDDLPELPGLRIDFNNALLPPITGTDPQILSEHYPVTDWMIYNEENGFPSALNLQPSSRINLPTFESSALLIVRLYCVHTPVQPYTVQISDEDGNIYSSVDIVQTESRLMRCILPPHKKSILVSTVASGEPSLRLHHMRLAVVRFLPIQHSQPDCNST